MMMKKPIFTLKIRFIYSTFKLSLNAIFIHFSIYNTVILNGLCPICGRRNYPPQ